MAELWVPAALGSLLVCDIDPEQFTSLSDGDPISTGQDASGNGHDFIAAGSARPTWQTAELDGKAVMRFDGSDDQGTISNLGITDPQFGIALVARFNSAVGADMAYVAGTGSSSAMTVWLDYDGADADLMLDFGTAESPGSWTGGTVTTTPLVVATSQAGVSTGFISRAFVDEDFATRYLGEPTTLDDLRLGADAAGTGRFAAMDLARFIVTGQLARDDLDRLLGYLAWEYGLEGTLPPGSPYESAAPALYDFQPSFFDVTRTQFAALSAPDDSARGKFLFVKGDSGEADYYAFAAKKEGGSRYWREQRDEVQFSLIDGVETFTNLGSGPTMVSAPWVSVDLTDYDEFQFEIRVKTAGTALGSAKMKARYTTDGSSWSDLGTSATVPLNEVNTAVSGWVNVASGARGIVTLSAAALDGDGSEDPEVVTALVRVRR